MCRVLRSVLILSFVTLTAGGLLATQYPSSTSLSSSPNPSTYGTSVGLTATITPNTATGSVSFYDGGSMIGSGTVSAGMATMSTSSLSVGSHSLTATYGGNPMLLPSTSGVDTQTVNKGSSSTSVRSSANPSTYGSSVTFTATVTPSSATGTVTFYDNGGQIGTGSLSGGSATFSTSTLAVGSHPITASYGGSGNYNGSTSSALTQTVNKANSSTSVSSSSNPSIHGNSVTFTATVSPGSATGTVTFYDNGGQIGSGSLSGGTATFSTSALAVGSHPITASYGGDGNYNGSTSTALSQTVNPGASSTALSSNPNPSTYGGSVTFTATVTPTSATGTVTFKDNGSTIGTGTLSNGVATFSTSALVGGSHPITASYGGDTNDSPSTSSTLTQTVNSAGSTTSLTSSLNPSSYANAVTITATVTPSTATGTVTFFDANGTLTLGSGTLSNGQTALTLSTMAPGPHSITATYNGDANDIPSTSAVLAQTVNRRTTTMPSYCSPLTQ